MSKLSCILIAVVFGAIGIGNIVANWSGAASGFARLYSTYPGLTIAIVVSFSLMTLTGILIAVTPEKPR